MLNGTAWQKDAKKKIMLNRRKRSKKPNGIRSTENIRERRQSFLTIAPL